MDKQPSSGGKIGVNWLWVLRDVAVVWGFCLLVFFCSRFVPGAVSSRYSNGFALLINVALGIVAFTVAGCLTPAKRYRHLSVVAGIFWLTSLLSVLFSNRYILNTLVSYVMGFAVIYVIMLFGYGISLLIVSEKKDE